MAKLNKNEIIEIVSEKTFVTKKEVREIIDETLSLISLALEAGNEVNLTNFGTFVPKKRAGKKGFCSACSGWIYQFCFLESIQ